MSNTSQTKTYETIHIKDDFLNRTINIDKKQAPSEIKPNKSPKIKINILNQPL